jgi:hypothetical protein
MPIVPFPTKTEQKPQIPELQKGAKIYMITRIMTKLGVMMPDGGLAQMMTAAPNIGLIGMLPVFLNYDEALAFCKDPELIITFTAK